MIEFTALHPRARDFLGFIPMFFSDEDSRPAREQIDTAYAHGGGWHPFKGFTFDPDNLTLTYPEDPPYKAVAMAKLRDETIYVFPYAWVLIMDASGSWEVARID